MKNLGNLQKMLEKAQKMQEKLAQEMEEMEVEGTSGGGMVTIRMNGHKRVLSIAINKEVINPEDPEMLQDLILSAFNEANRRTDEEVKSKVGGLAGGFPIPGLSGLF